MAQVNLFDCLQLNAHNIFRHEPRQCHVCRRGNLFSLLPSFWSYVRFSSPILWNFPTTWFA